MWLTWLATVFSLMTSSCAITRLVLPRARSRRISSSRWVRPSGEAVAWLDDRVQVSGCRERVERSACGARLHGGCVVVAERGTGLGDEQTGAGGVVAHAEGVELVEGAAQLDERCLRVALGSRARRRRRGRRALAGAACRAWPPLDGAPRRRRGRRSCRRSRARSRRRERADGPATIGSWASSRARRIMASAAADRPWASRSRARPGWGSRPYSLARW